MIEIPKLEQFGGVWYAVKENGDYYSLGYRKEEAERHIAIIKAIKRRNEEMLTWPIEKLREYLDGLTNNDS